MKRIKPEYRKLIKKDNQVYIQTKFSNKSEDLEVLPLEFLSKAEEAGLTEEFKKIEDLKDLIVVRGTTLNHTGDLVKVYICLGCGQITLDKAHSHKLNMEQKI